MPFVHIGVRKIWSEVHTEFASCPESKVKGNSCNSFGIPRLINTLQWNSWDVRTGIEVLSMFESGMAGNEL